MNLFHRNKQQQKVHLTCVSLKHFTTHCWGIMQTQFEGLMCDVPSFVGFSWLRWHHEPHCCSAVKVARIWSWKCTCLQVKVAVCHAMSSKCKRKILFWGTVKFIIIRKNTSILVDLSSTRTLTPAPLLLLTRALGCLRWSSSMIDAYSRLCCQHLKIACLILANGVSLYV